MCKGLIQENSKAYACSNWKTQDGGCKFTIWKVFLGKLFSIFTEEEMIQMAKGFNLVKMDKNGVLRVLQYNKEKGKVIIIS